MALQFLFNPISGQFDYVDTTAATGGYQVEKFTLNGTDITNKYVDLSLAPAIASATRLVVITGIEQDYGTDFQMISSVRLSWSSLGLESILASGDKLVIVYKT